MKAELAEQLIGTLMGWDRTIFQDRVRKLDALATLKFDEYGNFRPGVKFFESLAGWLDQFEAPEDRMVALDFVLTHLIFVSDAEMTHLIELVYPDHIEPVLQERVAKALGIPAFEVAKIQRSPEFKAAKRRSLLLGASDGTRLDRLRRSAPLLSHEQFLQASEPTRDLIKPMCDKLGKALPQLGLDVPATFAHIFLIDDFSGSGETLLREEGRAWKGKLSKLRTAVEQLRKSQELVAEDVAITVILYLASDQARNHLATELARWPGPQWEVRIVQPLPNTARVDLCCPDFAKLAESYYDEVLTDEHKGRAPLGYGSCSLPLILSHNTPNNSVSLLWAETPEAPGGLGRKALFPRYERHHRDRP